MILKVIILIWWYAMIMDYFADAVSWGAYVCAEQNGLMAVNGDDVINVVIPENKSLSII